MEISPDDLKKKIILAPDYLLERIDNEYTVYHPTLTVSVYLNETGGLIWELCNGQRSTADITALLTEIYPESREHIVADVLNIIISLKENNIVRLQD